MFHLVGIIASERDEIAETYARAIGTQSIFEAKGMRDARSLLAWARRSINWQKRKVIIVLTDEVVPYLFIVKERYDPQMVLVRFDHTRLIYDYDAIFEPCEIGWGVDKKKWKKIARNRRPKTKPTFFMLDRSAPVESRIQGLGYDIAYGGPERFYLGDIAIQPHKVSVPNLMYQAAASGMAVISSEDNDVWTRPLGAYNDVRLEDGVDAMIHSVKNSDFVYAGWMAADMVPSLGEFRVRIRALLEKNLSNWS